MNMMAIENDISDINNAFVCLVKKRSSYLLSDYFIKLKKLKSDNLSGGISSWVYEVIRQRFVEAFRSSEQSDWCWHQRFRKR